MPPRQFDARLRSYLMGFLRPLTLAALLAFSLKGAAMADTSAPMGTDPALMLDFSVAPESGPLSYFLVPDGVATFCAVSAGQDPAARAEADPQGAAFYARLTPALVAETHLRLAAFDAKGDLLLELEVEEKREDGIWTMLSGVEAVCAAPEEVSARFSIFEGKLVALIEP